MTFAAATIPIILVKLKAERKKANQNSAQIDILFAEFLDTLWAVEILPLKNSRTETSNRMTPINTFRNGDSLISEPNGRITVSSLKIAAPMAAITIKGMLAPMIKTNENNKGRLDRKIINNSETNSIGLNATKIPKKLSCKNTITISTMFTNT